MAAPTDIPWLAERREMADLIASQGIEALFDLSDITFESPPCVSFSSLPKTKPTETP